jgi:hypothetical protein
VNRATSATDTVSSTPVDILTNTITIGILSIPNADVTQRPTPILIDDQLDDSTPINMSILNINNIHNVHNNNNIHNIQEQRQSTICTQLTDVSDVWCTCGKTKLNKQCVKKKCKACCSALPGRCTIAQHNRAKFVPQPSSYATLINEAITQQLAIWIRYNGCSNPGTVRAVRPLKWISPLFSFVGIFALCTIVLCEKVRVRDQNSDY